MEDVIVIHVQAIHSLVKDETVTNNANTQPSSSLKSQWFHLDATSGDFVRVRVVVQADIAIANSLLPAETTVHLVMIAENPVEAAL